MINQEKVEMEGCNFRKYSVLYLEFGPTKYKATRRFFCMQR